MNFWNSQVPDINYNALNIIQRPNKFFLSIFLSFLSFCCYSSLHSPLLFFSFNIFRITYIHNPYIYIHSRLLPYLNYSIITIVKYKHPKDYETLQQNTEIDITKQHPILPKLPRSFPNHVFSPTASRIVAGTSTFQKIFQRRSSNVSQKGNREKRSSPTTRPLPCFHGAGTWNRNPSLPFLIALPSPGIASSRVKKEATPGTGPVFPGREQFERQFVRP